MCIRDRGYTAQVVRTKTVSVEVKTSGKPADGYRVSGVTLNRDSVVVYGDTNMLNSLDKIEMCIRDRLYLWLYFIA